MSEVDVSEPIPLDAPSTDALLVLKRGAFLADYNGASPPLPSSAGVGSILRTVGVATGTTLPDVRAGGGATSQRSTAQSRPSGSTKGIYDGDGRLRQVHHQYPVDWATSGLGVGNMITRDVLAAQLRDYLQHRITRAALVRWAEEAMMDATFGQRDLDTIRDIVARLGLADVREFGLTWEDCDDHLSRLGYRTRVDVVQVS